MYDVWIVLGVLAAVLLPMLLAGWLLGRPPRRHSSGRDAHGKIRAKEDR